MYDSIKSNVFKFLFLITDIRVLLLRKQCIRFDHKADSSIGSPCDPLLLTGSVRWEPSHDVGIHKGVCLFSNLPVHIVVKSVVDNSSSLNLHEVLCQFIVIIDAHSPLGWLDSIHLLDVPFFDVHEPDVTKSDPGVMLCFSYLDFAGALPIADSWAFSYHDLVFHEVIDAQ